MTLQLPLERLPETSAARHAALRNYFCDKDAVADAGVDGWTLDLAWPAGAERHVDPRLEEGLAWWGGGLGAGDMAMARRRSGPIFSALYDTWTLYSWSEWLARRPVPPETEVRILHVDDHFDLMAPRLIAEHGDLRDPIGGGVCDLERPETVQAALESGALGMGSFMTPFLHRFPRAEVRHLCQPPKALATEDWRFQTITAPDDLLEPGRPRPAIQLDAAPGRTGAGTYRRTPDVDAWLEDLGDGPVLLHIDMDYFNNRYDGDSGWAEFPPRFDPPLDDLFAKIDRLADGLARTGVGRRLADIVIAYSPGFFPAELWAPAEARLRPRLEALHD